MSRVGIFIDATTGNLGIGTEAPRQYFDVQGGNAIISGNVGIGTTAPLTQLDVNGFIRASHASFHVVSEHTTNTSGNNSIITGNAQNGYNITRHNTGIWNGTTGYVTASISGYYMFSYSVYNNGGNHRTTLRKNATTSITGTEYASTFAFAAGNTPHYGSASGLIYLSVGDTVSIWHGDPAANIGQGPSNYFYGHLIMAG